MHMHWRGRVGLCINKGSREQLSTLIGVQLALKQYTVLLTTVNHTYLWTHSGSATMWPHYYCMTKSYAFYMTRDQCTPYLHIFFSTQYCLLRYFLCNALPLKITWAQCKCTPFVIISWNLFFTINIQLCRVALLAYSFLHWKVHDKPACSVHPTYSEYTFRQECLNICVRFYLAAEKSEKKIINERHMPTGARSVT